jgi:hypothetical protein
MNDDFDLDKIRLPAEALERVQLPEKNRPAEVRVTPGKKRPFLCWPPSWDDQLGGNQEHRHAAINAMAAQNAPQE